MNLDPSKSTFRNHTHEHSLIKKYIFSESQKKGGSQLTCGRLKANKVQVQKGVKSRWSANEKCKKFLGFN